MCWATIDRLSGNSSDIQDNLALVGMRSLYKIVELMVRTNFAFRQKKETLRECREVKISIHERYKNIGRGIHHANKSV